MAKKLTVTPKRKNRSKHSLLFEIIKYFIVFICSFGLVVTVLTLQKKPSPVTNPTSITDVQALKNLKNRLIAIVNKQDPREAMNILSGMLHDDRIANECHALTHFIGNAAYDKYKDVSIALMYSNEMCGSGYMHGVIEEKFSQIKSDEEIYQAFTTICSPQNLGICFHGIGHGFMWYSQDNLHLALASCDELPQQYQRNNCYDGVFMENFEGDHTVHPTNYLNAQNPSYPCNQITYQYKESCYFYSARYYLTLYPQKYLDAFAWCRTLEDGFQLTCIKGVGSAMMKQNLNEPTLVASYCNQTKSSDEKTYCVDGMVSYYLTNFYSIRKGVDMCEELQDADKEACIQSTKIRENLFPN